MRSSHPHIILFKNNPPEFLVTLEAIKYYIFLSGDTTTTSLKGTPALISLRTTPFVSAPETP